MRILVTGSAGHLGEGLMRTLAGSEHEAIGVDVKPSAFTHEVGSITDRAVVRRSIRGIDAVIHTATLHKPHVATHSRQEFVDANVTGTLNLLEEAAEAEVETFVFTSTTSAFGRALTPQPEQPAAWITEDLAAIPKNIYGVTKTAAEDLCELFHRARRFACIVLRTSRFFPEEDDDERTRDAYDPDNAKVNELLYRRADIDDIVAAHLAALRTAPRVGFGRYIVTATTPFTRADLGELRRDAAAVVKRYFPAYEDVYRRRGWRMFPEIDRVYVNDRARRELDWTPQYHFGRALELLDAGGDYRSPLTHRVGRKGYHAEAFGEGL